MWLNDRWSRWRKSSLRWIVFTIRHLFPAHGALTPRLFQLKHLSETIYIFPREDSPVKDLMLFVLSTRLSPSAHCSISPCINMATFDTVWKKIQIQCPADFALDSAAKKNGVSFTSSYFLCKDLSKKTTGTACRVSTNLNSSIRHLTTKDSLSLFSSDIQFSRGHFFAWHASWQQHALYAHPSVDNVLKNAPCLPLLLETHSRWIMTDIRVPNVPCRAA